MVAPDAHRPGSREPSLEMLRVFALLAGFAIHAVVPYMQTPVADLAWSVQDTARTPIADFGFWWARCAQGRTFFFIAGIVSAWAIHSRGVRGFALARVRRLGIPLLAAIAFVLPLVALVWSWGWVVSGRAEWAEVLAWKFADPVIQVNSVGPAHLWFLEDLLIISLAFAILSLRFDLAALRGWAMLAIVLCGPVILAIQPDILFGITNTFAPNPARLAYGATFFAAGVWLANRRAWIARWPRTPVLFAGAAFAAGGVAYLVATTPLEGAARVLAAFLASGAGWLSILAGFRWVSRREFSLSPIAGQLAALSYVLYLIHLPVVGAVQVLLFPLEWSAGPKLVLVFSASLIASVVLATSGRRAAAHARDVQHAVSAVVPPRAAVIAAVTIGLGLRIVHYLRNPDVWHDEAALLVNVVERGYGRLLEPLTFHEASPPMFLWIQHWLASHLDASTWTVRLVPLLASCVALPVMVSITRRGGVRMAAVAVLLMATSTRLLFHSVEAKAYAVDVLLATVTIWTFLATRAWGLPARAAFFAAAAPLLVWTSYPGVFIVGGVLCALCVEGYTDRRLKNWLAIALLAGVVVASLVALVVGPVRAQRSAEIYAIWQWAFPAKSDPLTLVIWCVRSLFAVADYCFRPFGGLLLIPTVIGIAAHFRRGDRAYVALLVAPIVLALLAGLTRQYPFAGARTMIYALPALALIAAEGVAVIVERARTSSRWLPATCLTLAVVPPLALCTRDLVYPWRRLDTAAASEIVLAARRPGELVAAGQWEYRYYFRQIGQAFVDLGEQALPQQQHRLWLILHGPDAARHRVATVLQPFYRVASLTELQGVSVVELRGPDDHQRIAD